MYVYVVKHQSNAQALAEIWTWSFKPDPDAGKDDPTSPRGKNLE
jgi:hypothetical protein